MMRNRERIYHSKIDYHTLMANTAFFQTRARAIDHLGRGQIADCPTAVTELWKNSHDAYAKQVSLHIFQGAPHVAAIFDDGCGMTLDDILERWLTIGTESKAASEIPKSDRFGLAERPKLGEKGIGRLSAGFLAPVTLLVTKKAKSRFAAALVDWRFFENPFLLITDIEIPCEEFDSLEQLPKLVERMVTRIQQNISGKNARNNDGETTDRRVKRIKEAWTKFSKIERSEGATSTTEARIKALHLTGIISDERLTRWPLARNEVDHGTAIFLVDLNRELAVWVDPKVDADDEEADEAKRNLKSTLTGFITPECLRQREFSYYLEVHSNGGSKIRLDSNDQITSEYLRTLEHHLNGTINCEGWFNGEVTAFGQSQGQCEFHLNVSGLTDHRGQSKVGELTLEAAAIEQDPTNSTHDEATQTYVKKLQKEAGGMMVYRDGVRVLPYGRPDSDFFELDFRRGMHQGREFWAHKRVFGRVYLSRTENPKLKDKAGREGLVDNEAKRLMRSLIVAVLKETARRYFGSDSPIRSKEIDRIQARNKKGREAGTVARKIRRKDFLTKLREVKKAIGQAEDHFDELRDECQVASKSKDSVVVVSALESIESLLLDVEELEISPLPKGLEEREDDYREVRDRIDALHEATVEMQSGLSNQLASLKESEPAAIIAKFREKQIAVFSKQAKGVSQSLVCRMKELQDLWSTRLSLGAEELDAATVGFVEEVSNGESVTWAMEEIQAEVGRLTLQLLDDCRSTTKAIDLLLQGVDLDSALTVSDEGEMSANEKIQQLNLLAQSGIAVELISHELETLSSETEYNLKRLPDAARKTAPYKRALDAFSALVDRFRFLTPLSVATYRNRREITGREIAKYVTEFFVRKFESQDVSFSASKSFENIQFSDVPSRIFPVFINLVNNSLFWLKFSKKKRQIRLDFRDGLVIVADSGPGVDEDDVDNLFQMFFTKRPQGRGIGLYLCRANLAVARHAIRYATPPDPVVLPGANFIIEFRGING